MHSISAHQLAMLIIMAVVVILLRAMPFILFRGKRVTLPPILDYLGKVMTAAAIAMLVIYSYAGLCNFSSPEYARLIMGIPATIVTVVVHLLSKNPLCSICSGTAVYMVLVQKFC